MRLIKVMKTKIIAALTCIFNQSLNTGILTQKNKDSKCYANTQERVFDRYIKLPFNLPPSINIKHFGKTNFQTIEYIFNEH